jgi:hypothetical protein
MADRALKTTEGYQMSNKRVGLVELVTAIGNDGLKIQSLDTCITNMQKRSGHNEFTFGSEQSFSIDGTEELGIVVWMSRDKVKSIMGE